MNIGVECYRADPDGLPRGAVILIHEIWGLVPHITDVADRLAGEGYVVLAPDLLSEVGIHPAVGSELQQLMFTDDDDLRAAGQPRLREAFAPLAAPEYAAWALRVLSATVDAATAIEGVGDRIAVLGFCFGGSYAFALAAADPRVRAAVPFYGEPPVSAELATIACPILAFYGELDEGLVAGLGDLTSRMSQASIDFTPVVYSGERHAFFNDQNPATYSSAAASDAWARSLAFLARTLAS